MDMSIFLPLQNNSLFNQSYPQDSSLDQASFLCLNSNLESCFSVSSQHYTVECRPLSSGPWVSHPTLKTLESQSKFRNFQSEGYHPHPRNSSLTQTTEIPGCAYWGPVLPHWPLLPQAPPDGHRPVCSAASLAGFHRPVAAGTHWWSWQQGPSVLSGYLALAPDTCLDRDGRADTAMTLAPVRTLGSKPSFGTQSHDCLPCQLSQIKIEKDPLWVSY